MTIILTDEEVMKATGRRKTSYYKWKKARPQEYKLIRDALVMQKFNILFEEEMEKARQRQAERDKKRLEAKKG